VRVVRRDDGTLAAGRTLPGRGAWLCRGSGDCVVTAQKRRAFERALRGPVAPGAAERLFRELEIPTDDQGRDGPAASPVV
jgi:predicted RNA-binding protein YlxR (DUF448 family)